ncbi:MAG TPA: response regulator transcription factor [Pyrinomonadaceae bacterium]|nr:response regulator transcription factor [Pyrinomonadaceae bacterium]
MNATSPIRILAVDDHPMLLEGIFALLESESDMVVIAGACNGREAIDQFRAHRPDVTLMDLQMPVMSGNEAIRAIRRDFPEARIIVLTTYTGDSRTVEAFKAGASGYLLKNEMRKELAGTIRSIHAGEKKIPPEIEVQLEIKQSCF